MMYGRYYDTDVFGSDAMIARTIMHGSGSDISRNPVTLRRPSSEYPAYGTVRSGTHAGLAQGLAESNFRQSDWTRSVVPYCHAVQRFTDSGLRYRTVPGHRACDGPGAVRSDSAAGSECLPEDHRTPGHSPPGRPVY
eukprot:764193-Hanusia_phi.AAC.1